MKDIIEINGEQLTIVSNALLPRLYRFHFGRDLIVDMRKLAKSYIQVGEKEDGSPIYEMSDDADTSALEQISWLMLKAGGNDVGETIDEWLMSIEDVFDLWRIEGACMDLWKRSEKQTATLKKKAGRPSGK